MDCCLTSSGDPQYFLELEEVTQSSSVVSFDGGSTRTLWLLYSTTLSQGLYRTRRRKSLLLKRVVETWPFVPCVCLLSCMLHYRDLNLRSFPGFNFESSSQKRRIRILEVVLSSRVQETFNPDLDLDRTLKGSVILTRYGISHRSSLRQRSRRKRGYWGSCHRKSIWP